MKYIDSEKEFNNIFSKRLYEKIVKENSISLNISKSEYKQILDNLFYKLVNYEYKPSPIVTKIFTYKTNNVARILPVLNVEDELFYYFVCKMIEEEIAINRTPYTYGGWVLGNLIKLEEESEIDYVYKSFNPELWNKNWKAFQSIVKQETDECEENAIILKLDIANFYDNINLNILEKKILSAVKSDKLEYVNMLMFFLKNWNLKNDKYQEKTVGIPQNQYGDQSRILANFYLQNYDSKISKFCEKRNAKYIRYADDQIIIINDINKENEILYFICKELNNIGLNLNASKVGRYTKKEIQIFYGLDIFELLDENKYDEAIDVFIKYKTNSEIRFNYSSSIKRILNIGLDKFNLSNRSLIKSIITEYQFLREANDYYMKKIYENIEIKERETYINILMQISRETVYNGFHYSLLKFLKKIKADNDLILQVEYRIKEIEKIVE